MSESIQGHGRCICGSVEVEAKALSPHLGACHCRTCQRWGGGPFMTVEGGKDVRFTGEAHITTYQSSEWAERGFCNQCGSHLFYRLKANHQYFMPAGLFDEFPQLTFQHQVFIDEKPDNYRFANQTETMTGAEVFAKFAPPEA